MEVQRFEFRSCNRSGCRREALTYDSLCGGSAFPWLRRDGFLGEALARRGAEFEAFLEVGNNPNRWDPERCFEQRSPRSDTPRSTALRRPPYRGTRGRRATAADD